MIPRGLQLKSEITQSLLFRLYLIPAIRVIMFATAIVFLHIREDFTRSKFITSVLLAQQEARTSKILEQTLPQHFARRFLTNPSSVADFKPRVGILAIRAPPPLSVFDLFLALFVSFRAIFVFKLFRRMMDQPVSPWL
jgi:hypothetical protein